MLTVRAIAFKPLVVTDLKVAFKGPIGTIGTPRGNLSRGSVHHSVAHL
jgi:hypothetical protein